MQDSALSSTWVKKTDKQEQTEWAEENGNFCTLQNVRVCARSQADWMDPPAEERGHRQR